jgi:hypothetical protein
MSFTRGGVFLRRAPRAPRAFEAVRHLVALAVVKVRFASTPLGRRSHLLPDRDDFRHASSGLAHICRRPKLRLLRKRLIWRQLRRACKGRRIKREQFFHVEKLRRKVFFHFLRRLQPRVCRGFVTEISMPEFLTFRTSGGRFDSLASVRTIGVSGEIELLPTAPLSEGQPGRSFSLGAPTDKRSQIDITRV